MPFFRYANWFPPIATLLPTSRGGGLAVVMALAFATPSVMLAGLPPLTDLGNLGGGYSSPLALNEAGQIICMSGTANNLTRIFIWDLSHGIRDIGTLGGSNITAAALSAAGQIIGDASTTNGFSHAFIWDATNGMRDLGTLGGTDANAVAINGASQIVGDTTLANGKSHAFIWDATGGMRDLGTLGSDCLSYALAINSSGLVLGYSSSVQYAAQHAFVWDAVHGIQDLGNLGGGINYVVALNEAGQAIGSSMTASGENHAFIWDATHGMRDLGTLGGTYNQPIAINSSGQVIGLSSKAGDSPLRAYVWDATHGMHCLTLGGSNSLPYAINDAGQVVGDATTTNELKHAFIWDAANGIRDLSTLGGSYANAVALNAGGQVVGDSTIAGELEDHAFIWDATNGRQDLGTFGGGYSAAYMVNSFGQIVGDATTFGEIEDDGFFVSVPNSKNIPPTAKSKNVTVAADNTCTATASINDGSFDADSGDIITLVQTPAGPYSIGTTTVTLTVTDSHGATSVSSATVTVVDTTAPIITLNGSNPMTVECHGTFTDPGASANDNCAGSVTVITTGSVNPNAPGTYTLTYNAVDASSNKTSVTRTVLVKDTTAPIAPVLTNITAQCSATLIAPTAIDACAGSVTGTTTNLLTYNPQGTFTVHWVFNDGNGNSTAANQTVIIKDTVAPVITLNGSNPMSCFQQHLHQSRSHRH